MIYLIFLLAIGLLVGWSLWKAPSDIDLWGKRFRGLIVILVIF